MSEVRDLTPSEAAAERLRAVMAAAVRVHLVKPEERDDA